jgi:hypothetical protein
MTGLPTPAPDGRVRFRRPHKASEHTTSVAVSNGRMMGRIMRLTPLIMLVLPRAYDLNAQLQPMPSR